MTLHRICATVVLMLALALPILAGEIDCPGVISPPPTGTTSTSNVTTISTNDITTSVILAIVNLIN